MIKRSIASKNHVFSLFTVLIYKSYVFMLLIDLFIKPKICFQALYSILHIEIAQDI